MAAVVAVGTAPQTIAAGVVEALFLLVVLALEPLRLVLARVALQAVGSVAQRLPALSVARPVLLAAG